MPAPDRRCNRRPRGASDPGAAAPRRPRRRCRVGPREPAEAVPSRRQILPPGSPGSPPQPPDRADGRVRRPPWPTPARSCPPAADAPPGRAPGAPS